MSHAYTVQGIEIQFTPYDSHVSSYLRPNLRVFLTLLYGLSHGQPYDATTVNSDTTVNTGVVT